MLHKPHIRHRHYEWLRSNRSFLFETVTNKFNYARVLTRVLDRSKFVKKVGIYFFFTKRRLSFESRVSNLTWFHKRCLFSGKARGVRFSLNRLRLISLSYSGNAGSMFSSRW